MEAFFRTFPVKLNPVTSVAIVFGLAFVSILEKIILTRTANKHKGTVDSTSNSRFVATLILNDHSPNGLRMSRLVGCHINGLEAFSYYSIAVLLAICTKVDKELLSGVAGAFVACRVAYTAVYLSPLNGPLRTLTFLGGVTCSVFLMLAAAGNYEEA